MPRNKLAKLLLEDQTTESTSGQHVNTFGVDQIIDIQAALSARLHAWDNSVVDYNPLFEIAKLALCTDNEDLRFKCHARLADHLYPQVKSLEIQSKQDREVKITINIAGYAQPRKMEDVIEVEPDDIDTEGDADEEEIRDHTEWVLKENIKKGAE